MLEWAISHRRLHQAGVEGTHSYGAGLTRHLHAAGIDVLEVNQPDKANRRRRGKTDALDAEAAARAVLSGRATATANELVKHLTAAVSASAPDLLERRGVGPDTASALLLAAGDNPQRLTDEAAFAALCGVSPVEASSGETRRHRLNRGGDRHANWALHTIVINRLRWDTRTHDYAARRTAGGKPAARSSAASNATSPAKSSPSSPTADSHPPLDMHRGIKIRGQATISGVTSVHPRTGRPGRPADTPQCGRCHAPIRSRRSALTTDDPHDAAALTLTLTANLHQASTRG